MKALYKLIGAKFFDAEPFLRSLPDGEPLELVREPENQHDDNAIRVHARGAAIGYVGRGQRQPTAEEMAAGKKYLPGNENEPLARYIDDHGREDATDSPTATRKSLSAKLVAGRPAQIEVEET